MTQVDTRRSLSTVPPPMSFNFTSSEPLRLCMTLRVHLDDAPSHQLGRVSFDNAVDNHGRYLRHRGGPELDEASPTWLDVIRRSGIGIYTYAGVAREEIRFIRNDHVLLAGRPDSDASPGTG